MAPNAINPETRLGPSNSETNAVSDAPVIDVRATAERSRLSFPRIASISASEVVAESYVRLPGLDHDEVNFGAPGGRRVPAGRGQRTPIGAVSHQPGLL